MSFDKMAEIVHEMVQSKSNGEIQNLRLKSFKDVNPNEKQAIINGFYKMKSSGNSLAVELEPNVYWA